MFKVGDRVVVVKSCRSVLVGRLGTVVDDKPLSYGGHVTVEFDSPMPFVDADTKSCLLRIMHYSCLKRTEEPQPNSEIDIKFSFDSLIGE